jgi:uncharacterized membrane protein
MKAVAIVFSSLVLGMGLCMPFATIHAQTEEQIQQTDQLLRARVVSAESEGESLVPGTNITSSSQTLTVEILDEPNKGQFITFRNDYTQLSEGDVFYARHVTSVNDGTDHWSVSDPYRLPLLIGIALAFVVLLFVFGGLQGIRGLASLIGSLFLIGYLLLPGIYAGYSPILVSIGISSLIIILGSYVTHGFNRTTTSAMLGMLVTVLVTGAATYWAIHAADLSGFTSETNAYLNFSTDGRISMVGLLFGGIIIGLLGVLYDMAIGQAVAVEELYRAGTYNRLQAIKRAMRIGREHIGALVNTLAIAYVGSALPLLLLFKETTAGIGYILNSEQFATEIIRILMGSIGLVLAVPITTVLAAFLLEHMSWSEKSTHSHSH